MSGCLTCGKKKTAAPAVVPTGMIPTGNIVWDGTDFTCAVDPSLDTAKNDPLNTVLLRIFNKICKTDCCFQTTTYTALTTMITAGTLTPGTAYVFPYQSIHNIDNNAGTVVYNSQINAAVGLPQTLSSTSTYDDGTANTKTGFSADLEHLVVYATSASTIDSEAFSQEYPNDIIHYDHTLSTTEDGAINRPGFIVFRHDTDHDVSAWFDWRNILHRRYEMDITGSYSRDTEWEAFVDYVAVIPSSFPSSGIVNAAIPNVVPFAIAGNTNLGGLITATKGTFVDYKTISMYNSDPSHVHQNIHIDKASANVSVLAGSGLGTNLATGQFNGTTIPNVVLWGIDIRNVKIGANVSGVHLASLFIKDIEIGDEVQNVSFGGQTVQPIVNNTGGYLQDIKVGNMSRDIFIADWFRNIKIGNGNVGLFGMFNSDRVEIGDQNTQVFWFAAKNVKIGSANVNTFLWNCRGLDIGDGNDNTRLKLVSDGNPTAHYSSVNTLLKPGFETPLSTFPLIDSQAQAKAVIGNGNKNIRMYVSSGCTIGSSIDGLVAIYATNLIVGNNCVAIDIYSSDDSSIGQFSSNCEITQSRAIALGDYNMQVKVLNTTDVKIGKACNTVFLINQAGDGSVIGDFSIQIYARGGTDLAIGTHCSNITVRAASAVHIGPNCDGIYIESGNSITIGSNSNSIVMSPIGMRYPMSFPISATRRFTDQIGALDAWSAQTNMYTISGVTATPNSVLQGTIPAAFPAADLAGHNNTTIGSHCSGINICSSWNTTIEDNCSQVHIGTYQDYAFTTPNTYDAAGAIQPYDEATVIATATFDGNFANFNSIEENCSEIRIIGPKGAGPAGVYDYWGNHIGENVIGIYTNVSLSLVDTSVMLRRRNDTTKVDLATLTLTAAYASKLFDRKSPDGELWEQSINNAGALQTPAKLV